MRTDFIRKVLQVAILFTLNFLFVSHAFSQETDLPELTRRHNFWSAGFKFNNPSGITIKKYFNNKAIEITAGMTKPWKHRYYYQMEYKEDLQKNGYTYSGYNYIYRPLALQIHYLVHNRTDLMGFSWYYGFGAQVRSSSYYYYYSYTDGNNVLQGRKRRESIGLGGDAVLGIEYIFNSIPLTIFYDANIYMEAFRHPFYTKVQSGLGIRYNFR